MVRTTSPPQPSQPTTMRINLQVQPMGPQGGYQPFVYTFIGTVKLQQIELPTDAGNLWVAAINLPKLGYSTDYCGDATYFFIHQVHKMLAIQHTLSSAKNSGEVEGKM